MTDRGRKNFYWKPYMNKIRKETTTFCVKILAVFLPRGDHKDFHIKRHAHKTKRVTTAKFSIYVRRRRIKCVPQTCWMFFFLSFPTDIIAENVSSARIYFVSFPGLGRREGGNWLWCHCPHFRPDIRPTTWSLRGRTDRFRPTFLRISMR